MLTPRVETDYTLHKCTQWNQLVLEVAISWKSQDNAETASAQFRLLDMSEFITRSIELQTLTWIRDSNELFDYDDPFLVKQTFDLSGTSKVLRLSDLCIVREDCESTYEEASSLGIVSLGHKGRGAAFLSEASDGRVWQVVRAMSRCRLEEGDVFKVGRVLLEVKQLSVFGYEEPQVFTGLTHVCFFDQGMRQTCRICLSDAHTQKDPLISPCKCAGSVQFIHVNCLREWLKTKLDASANGRSTVYSWTSPHCELCKDEFPLSISVDGTCFSLISVQQANYPFVVLQVTNMEVPEPEVNIHVVGLRDGSSAFIVTLT